MHERAVLVAALLCVCLALSAAGSARAQELDELQSKLSAQDEVIQELRSELDRMREEQQQSEDRVRALEDQMASGSAGAAPSGAVDREYVDERIEDFEKAPSSRIFLSGYGTAQFEQFEDQDSTFNAQFNPIFHYWLNDKFHFVAEPQITFGKVDGETETEFELEFLQSDYLVTDWLTISAGKMLVPFNAFGPKLHPQWINKLASAPPVYGGHHGGGAPGIIPIIGDVGLMASGGTALWDEGSKLNYALYVVNGPSFGEEEHDEHALGMLALANGAEEHEESRAEIDAELLELQFENIPDNNDNKSVGGRIGFLPVPNLELGLSYLSGRTGGPGSHFNLAGADAWYWWQGLELRGEFIRLSREAEDKNPDVWGYWAQAAYRLGYHIRETTGWQGFVGRLEPVVRWSEIEDLAPLEREQIAVGLNYWFRPSIPFKVTYEFNTEGVEDDRLFLQFAYGF